MQPTERKQAILFAKKLKAEKVTEREKAVLLAKKLREIEKLYDQVYWELSEALDDEDDIAGCAEVLEGYAETGSI